MILSYATLGCAIFPALQRACRSRHVAKLLYQPTVVFLPRLPIFNTQHSSCKTEKIRITSYLLPLNTLWQAIRLSRHEDLLFDFRRTFTVLHTSLSHSSDPTA